MHSKYSRRKNNEKNVSKNKPQKTSAKKKNNSGDSQKDNQQLRLNKYIAHSGLCSRRKADEFIQAGNVKVNEQVITDLGSKVSYRDKVIVNGNLIKPERNVYILLNKPKDYITTVKDSKASKTVMELVQHACNERIYPVGRLDRNTTGVLLFTNDGELTKKLTHPSHNKKKIYHVVLKTPFSQPDMDTLRNGIELDSGFFKPDAVDYAEPSDKKQIGIEIHSGENRIVRRLFEHLNYQISKLDRVYFAGLTKKGLKRGRWRYLNEKEINHLKMT